MRLKRDIKPAKPSNPVAGDLQSIFREYMRLERKRASTGLSVEELQVWTTHKQTLNRRFEPGSHDCNVDRRESLRVPVRLDVSFESCGELHESLMTNLSRGGLFVSTPSPLEIGTKVQLRLFVRELGKPMSVTTEVVSHNVGGHRSTESGMGLRFVDLDAQQETFVGELYARSASRAIEALDGN